MLKAGVAESGCTIHVVDEGVDSGPIVVQKRCPVLREVRVCACLCLCGVE